MKRAVICGAGGFVGSHLAKRLKSESYHVVGIDLKLPEFSKTACDFFQILDLTKPIDNVWFDSADEVYQLAAEMGGAGFAFTGKHDAEIMRNSALINLNVVEASRIAKVKKLFFSSSACVYHDDTCEHRAYPAQPDSQYGWEKLFSERLYQTYAKQYGMRCKIARFQNVYGEEGCFEGGREKSIAAICRKVALMKDGGEIEIWGDGKQIRSFMHIGQCVEGIRRLMKSEMFDGPVNLGSTEAHTIEQIVKLVMGFAGKKGIIKYVPGPTGVKRRVTDNHLIKGKLLWEPANDLYAKLMMNYTWVENQIASKANVHAA